MRSSSSPLLIISLVLISNHIDALSNGAGYRPILGWTTGSRYPCITDCQHYPEDCISEHLIKVVADFLSLTSFQSSGYEYIVIGDCWMDQQRDGKGRLRGDGARFPGGMADLVSYVHKKKLKIGLQLDLGSTTCGGFPGSWDKYHTDAQTMADWDVDMVTVTGCGFDQYWYLNDAYIRFGSELMNAKRSILYSCDWPIRSIKKGGGHPSYPAVAQACNTFKIEEPVDNVDSMYRNLNDIKSVFYLFKDLLGNGSHVDLDEVAIGGYSLSEDSEKFQMAFWSMLTSPILISSDLINIPSRSKRLLLNKDVLSINQDPIGATATCVYSRDPVSVWMKPVLPTGSFALTFFSTSVIGLPAQVSVQLSSVGVSGSPRYNATELFTGHHYGVYKPWHYFNCEVEPMSVLLLRFIPI